MYSSNDKRFDKVGICFIGPMLGANKMCIPSPAEVLADLLIKEGYTCIITSRYLNPFLRAVDIIFTVLKNRKHISVFVVMVYSNKSFYFSVLGKYLAKFLNKKLIFYVHGGLFPEFIKRKKELVISVFSNSDCIIAPSHFLSEAICKLGFKVKIIPNILQIEKYQFRLRKNSAPRLFWMRTFHSYYNPIMALKVLELVKKNYSNATLTMAGYDMGMEKAVKKTAEKLGLNHSVRFVGFVDKNMKDTIADDHDIFLNTNRIDNQPVSIIEAAAYGFIILATKVGGIPYLLNDKKDSILVDDNDAQAMAEAVLNVLNNKNLAINLSCNARKLAEGYSWEKIKVKWETLLNTSNC